MNRIVTGDGRWFDADKAQLWGERREHDGRNYISQATGSQWEHERLYRTAKGSWVLRSWSDWQGSRESYRRVDDSEAHVWLLAQGHVEAVPAEALAAGEV